MNTEQNLWIKAEKDFHKWIEKPVSYPENEHTVLRKSIHIVFRRKYYDQLTRVLKKVFDINPPEIFLLEEDNPVIQENIFQSRDISYSPKTIYENRWSYEDNNKQI